MIRLVESFYVKSAVEPADYPASAYPEFAFAGKSNVGKSTLINLLTKHHQLAKTSSHPGKTRLLNFFLTRYKDEDQNQGFIQLTDLPGYGFAEVSQNEQEKWRKMVTKYLEQRIQLRAMILLVDIRHAADKKDILMLEMLRLRKIRHCIVATKSDKIPKTKIGKTVQILAKDLGTGAIPIFPVSSLNNTGFEPLLEWIHKLSLEP